MGQTGPLADVAGHDLNYLAWAGALAPDGGPPRWPAIPVADLSDVLSFDQLQLSLFQFTLDLLLLGNILGVTEHVTIFSRPGHPCVAIHPDALFAGAVLQVHQPA